MSNKTIMELICVGGDPLLYTSKDLCELLSQFIHDLDREYQGNRFDLLLESIEKKVAPGLFSLVCRAVQLIDKTITDGKNGVCSLSQGTTNGFLVKYLPEYKRMAIELSGAISEDIQSVKRETAFLISPVVNCLDKFTKLDDKIFENLSALTSNSVPTIRQVRDLMPDSEIVTYDFDINKIQGVIKIENFGELVLSGRRAVVFYFLYKERYGNEAFDYYDVNKYIDNISGVNKIGYDIMRTDVNHINKRVNKKTNGKIANIIENKSVKTENKIYKNKYKYLIH